MATLTQKLRQSFASNAFESLYSRKIAETKSYSIKINYLRFTKNPPHLDISFEHDQ